jgi:inner membrane protein
LLLFYAILYAWAPHIDTVEALSLSLVAATVAAAMSLKQDEDMKVLWGIFHRTWITHSLFTVLVATVGSYLLFDAVLKSGPLSLYVAIAVFSATMSHVLLDSLTKKGVPLYGPLDDTMRGLRWFRSSNVILNYAFLAAGVLMALFYYRII